MCKRCKEAYGKYACPICKTVTYVATWAPYLPSGILEPLHKSLDAMHVTCRTCGQGFGGRSDYMDHFCCPTCGIEKTCCTDGEHVCKDVVAAKLADLEAYWSAKLEKEQKAYQQRIDLKLSVISDLTDLLDEHGIEYDT